MSTFWSYKISWKRVWLWKAILHNIETIYFIYLKLFYTKYIAHDSSTSSLPKKGTGHPFLKKKKMLLSYFTPGFTFYLWIICYTALITPLKMSSIMNIFSLTPGPLPDLRGSDRSWRHPWLCGAPENDQRSAANEVGREPARLFRQPGFQRGLLLAASSAQWWRWLLDAGGWRHLSAGQSGGKKFCWCMSGIFSEL